MSQVRKILKIPSDLTSLHHDSLATGEMAELPDETDRERRFRCPASIDRGGRRHDERRESLLVRLCHPKPSF